MPVFVDESGDTGLKLGRGSSGFFTVALVVSEENDEAQAADVLSACCGADYTGRPALSPTL